MSNNIPSGSKRHRIHKSLSRVQGNTCAYCTGIMFRVPLNGPDYPTIDHVIPASRGGSSSKSNLVLVCKKCNEAKDSMLLKEYKQTEQYRAYLNLAEAWRTTVQP